MHEVVNLSFGPQANELNGQFYNAQQSYFVYTPEEAARSHVDPNVRFVYGREYTPRAIFWDYRNGYGQWKQYSEVYEEPQDHESITADQGKSTSIIKGTVALTTWTSRIKVPLHPECLHKIPDWEFDPDRYPYGHQRGALEDELREFDLYCEGAEQFETVSKSSGGKREDYLDVTLRPTLEKCDMIDGVNAVTDMGGWGGFTVPYVETMRDEYLPKGSIFTWAISRKTNKYPWTIQQSRIETLAAFSELSSLVLPIQDSIPTKNSVDIEQNSRGHLPIFETVSLLSSLRRGRISMHQLVHDATKNIPRANIVQSSMPGISASKINEFRGESNRTHNMIKIWRCKDDPKDFIATELEKAGLLDPEHNRRHYWCPQAWNTESLNCILEVNDDPLKLRNITKWGNHELREAVHDLTDPYVWGWNDTSDCDDVF